jgi:hypothetical protein
MMGILRHVRLLQHFRIVLAIVTLSIAGTPAIARAAVIVDITLDTSALTIVPGSLGAPFSVFFQLTDGSGVNDGNNTATLTGFTFDGGSPTSGTTVFGNAAGDLTTGVTMTDDGFLTSFSQGFTPGGLLSFRLTLTTNVDPGGTPDAFAFGLLDGTGTPIPTLDPNLADTLLMIVIDSDAPGIAAYGTDPERTAIAIAAAEARPVTGATPIPEPGTFTLVAFSLALFTRSRVASTRRSRSSARWRG